MIRTLAAVVMVGLLSAAAHAETFSYPSASSSVVGSVGFIDGENIGYFWSVARGDSVTETFASSVGTATDLKLDLAVPENVLSPGYQVDWNVRLNGVSVGGFSIPDGFTGNASFPYSSLSIPAVAGNYTVRMEVTNEVDIGAGSHTLAYAGEWKHEVTITPEPSALSMLAIGALSLIRRKR